MLLGRPTLLISVFLCLPRCFMIGAYQEATPTGCSIKWHGPGFVRLLTSDRCSSAITTTNTPFIPPRSCLREDLWLRVL
ncbi:hypothetical protein DPEC_G00085760 [Dallia pectoralis]|uniref:Uncharacterized protein n=1 Tax=Dallia pectoralis TaxID=75939 RepID=A0ACC2GZQ3_DALPE|nr:hypothetical protein DPEC_G00085760 [Dallia pectoralis]